MQLTIATATALALAHARFASAALGIDTPTSLVQCQPSLLAWHEGTPPYWLTVIPGGQPGAAPLKSFDATTDTSRTWIVDLAGGQPVSLMLKDGTGAVAYSDKVNIQPSPDNTCAQAPAPATPAAPPANGASASSPPPAPASQQPAAPAVSSPAPQAPRPPPASRPTGSQAAVASSSAKPSSGAIRTSVVNGFAGLLAVLGVALF